MVPYMNICGFPLTTSGKVFKKVPKEKKKSPRDHLGSVSEFHPKTSNPVAQKPNVNIYKALSILYPASFFFYAFSSPFPSSLFPWSSPLPFFPFALTSPTPISQAHHPFILKEASVTERKGLQTKPSSNTGSSRGWRTVTGAKPEEGHSPLWGSSPNRRLGFSQLDSCMEPHDFKAFRGWQGLANFKLSNQLQSQRTQDNNQWAKWNCWSEAALTGFALVALPHDVQLGLCFHK